jgi:hypothetical protein
MDECIVGGPDFEGSCGGQGFHGTHTIGNEWECGEFDQGLNFPFNNTKVGCHATCIPTG